MTIKPANPAENTTLTRTTASQLKELVAAHRANSSDVFVVKNLDLYGVDLSKQDLSNVRFYHCYLGDAKLVEADMVRCQFAKCVLDHADFSKANLTSALFNDNSYVSTKFDGATLSQSVLEKESFRDTSFVGVTATNTVFTRTRLHDADFSKAELVRTSFFDATFISAKFDEAVLDQTIFIRADLSDNPKFNGAKLSRVNFDGVSSVCPFFIGATIKATKLFNSAMFADSTFTGAALDMHNTHITVIPDIREQVWERVQAADAEMQNKGDYRGPIVMAAWHSCGTVHCLGGWICEVHPQGKLLEAIFGPSTAASFILAACGVPIPDFFDMQASAGATKRAINWLKTGKQENPVEP